MADNYVKIIMEVVDKASAQMSKVAKSIGGMGSAANAAVKGLTGFDISTLGAAAAVGMIAKGVADSVKLFTTYAEQVRTMSAATGMSNEETSKMIQVFDDANVEIGLFTAASRKMIQNGMQPSIENISKLADEYVALQDPVAKSKLLLDNFGKSGLAMGKLMEGGAKGILDSAEAAEKFGLVLDDKAIASAEEYRKALDDVGDAANGLKMKLGKALVPAMSGVVVEMNRVVDESIKMTYVTQKLDEAVKAGIITDERLQELYLELQTSGGDFSEIDYVIADAQAKLEDHSRMLPEYLSKQADETYNLAQAEEEAAAAAAIANDVYSNAIKALQDSNVPLAEKNRLLREFAVLSGKTTPAEQEMTRQVNIATLAYEAGALSEDGYREALDNIKDGIPYAVGEMGNLQLGMQNLSGSMLDAANKAHDLKEAISELRDKTVTVTTNYVNRSTAVSERRQFGGPVRANVPYLVGEAGLELFIPNTSGKIVPNNQLNTVSGKAPTGSGAAGISIGEINVYASDSMDEQSLAQLVIARLAAATRNSGYAGLDYAG